MPMPSARPRAALVVYSSGGRIRSQRWRWRLIETRSGRIVATSGEGYRDRAECVRMAMRVCGGDYQVTPPAPLAHHY